MCSSATAKHGPAWCAHRAAELRLDPCHHRSHAQPQAAAEPSRDRSPGRRSGTLGLHAGAAGAVLVVTVAPNCRSASPRARSSTTSGQPRKIATGSATRDGCCGSSACGARPVLRIRPHLGAWRASARTHVVHCTNCDSVPAPAATARPECPPRILENHMAFVATPQNGSADTDRDSWETRDQDARETARMLRH